MERYKLLFGNSTIRLTLDTLKNEYWLYDKLIGMNIAMGVKTEQEAFIQTITYYQKRLTEVKEDYKELYSKVESFVISVKDDFELE